MNITNSKQTLDWKNLQFLYLSPQRAQDKLLSLAIAWFMMWKIHNYRARADAMRQVQCRSVVGQNTTCSTSKYVALLFLIDLAYSNHEILIWIFLKWHSDIAGHPVKPRGMQRRRRTYSSSCHASMPRGIELNRRWVALWSGNFCANP